MTIAELVRGVGKGGDEWNADKERKKRGTTTARNEWRQPVMYNKNQMQKKESKKSKRQKKESRN
jgi:hypothetical protein